MNSKLRLLKVSLIGLSAIAGVTAAACSTSDAGDDSAAAGSSTGGTATGAGGSGGSTPIAGSTSTGGSSVGAGGSGGGAVVGMGTACPKPTLALISDFTATDAGAESNSFGDFTTTFSGSTFVYPNGTATYPLTADTTGGNWHITGTVGDYSGLGLAFSISNAGCNLVDASSFGGISFSIKGSVPIAGTLANTVLLTIGTAADDVASTWLNSHKATATTADVAANFGTCMPVSNQYDSTCGSPTFTVPVTTTATVINVKWSDLTGGKPMASVDPAKISFISWVLPTPPGVGMTPTTYDLDLTIDDLKFLPL